MVKVAFVMLLSSRWLGGTRYLQNLLYAISRLEKRAISPLVLLGEQTDNAVLSTLKPYAEILQDSIFDTMSARWIADRLAERVIGAPYLLNRVLEEHSIAVVSHALNGIKATKRFRTISWIPDFQHLHLPQMFSKAELATRDKQFSDIAKKSDLVILSSFSAQKDFLRFAPAYGAKARVLHFVAQPDPRAYTADCEQTERNFGIQGKYFFFPSQFWKHKNHRTLFEAIKRAKEKRRDIMLVCSGSMDDYRNKGHAGELVAYIGANNLQENIRLLGMIREEDLFCLMRNSIACINPSLFEGWSTTVEEAKSIGKSMILSDIPVHREQNPPAGVFFDPGNAEQLADILCEKFDAGDGGPDSVMEEAARSALEQRTVDFARQYQDIVLELAGR